METLEFQSHMGNSTWFIKKLVWNDYHMSNNAFIVFFDFFSTRKITVITNQDMIDHILYRIFKDLFEIRKFWQNNNVLTFTLHAI